MSTTTVETTTNVRDAANSGTAGWGPRALRERNERNRQHQTAQAKTRADRLRRNRYERFDYVVVSNVGDIVDVRKMPLGLQSACDSHTCLLIYNCELEATVAWYLDQAAKKAAGM